MTERLLEAQKGKHLDFLDGIRGVAVSYVLLYHFFPKTLSLSTGSPVWKLWDTFWMMGWSGVDLFFVLSGFLITGILYRAKDKPDYFKKFYVRRIFRIFPAYYALIIIAAIYFYPQQLSPFYWLYLSNFDVELHIPFNQFLCVAWSLSIEEQYYVFYPTLVYFLSEKNWRRLLIGLIVLSVSLRFFGHDHFFVARQMYHNTFAHFDGIALGGLIRLMLFRYESFKTLISAYVKLTPALFVAALAFGFYCGSQVLSNSIDAGGKFVPGLVSFFPPMYLFGYFLNSLLFGGIILTCIFKDGPLYKLASNPVLRNLGKYSYAMYLFQMPVSHLMDWLYALAHLPMQPMWLGVSKFIAVYLAARLSWLILESPMGKVRDWILSSGRKSDNMPVAAKPELAMQGAATSNRD